MRKSLLRKVSIIATLALVMINSSYDSANAEAVNDLTLKIGYFGWNTEDYVEKARYSISELQGMGTTYAEYSYYNGKSDDAQIALQGANGVSFDKILNAAGIDRGSIKEMDFWTADQSQGAFRSFTIQELFADAYYFPTLAECMKYDDKGKLKVDKSVWDRAKSVRPMLAYEDNWVWYETDTSGASPGAPNKTSTRLRICFGQTSPTDGRATKSAWQVHTIYIMFSGTPKLTARETNIEGKVGSTHDVKITAAQVADEALADTLLNNVQWSSSDSSIVSVDEKGNLKFHKKGEATITATSIGGITTEIKITVDDKDNDEDKDDVKDKGQDNDEDDDEDKDNVKDKGGGNGDGNGTGGKGVKDGTGKAHTTSTAKNKAKVEIKSNTYVLSENAGKNLKLALSRQAAAEDASMDTVQRKMDRDAEQLKIKEENNHMMKSIGLINGIILIEGGIFGFLRYKKQRFGRLWRRK